MSLFPHSLAARYAFGYAALGYALLAFVGSTPHANAENNQAPPGFTALFNGRDLTGWYGWSTRDPGEFWDMTPEEQAKYKKESIEGGLLDKKGQPSNDHLQAHWRVENGELINDGKGLYATTDKDTVTSNCCWNTRRCLKEIAASICGESAGSDLGFD